jgi:hypothetical protein
MNRAANRRRQSASTTEAADGIVGQLRCRAALAGEPSMVDVVAAVHSIPYGRPATRTSSGVLAEWKGTCSTKHLLLVAALRELWPDTEPRLVHRVYRILPAEAAQRYGDDVAACVPLEGLVDVHRFCVIHVDGADVIVDITFPRTPAWSGHSSMDLQCGDGDDHPVVGDPDMEKRALETRFCDPTIREPFIAALSRRYDRGDA